MPNFSDLYPSGGGIKSVQRGVTTPTNDQPITVTISPVNPAKTTVNLLTNNIRVTTGVDYGYDNQIKQELVLLSGTQLQVTSFAYYYYNTGYAGGGKPCSWEVIEWN